MLLVAPVGGAQALARSKPATAAVDHLSASDASRCARFRCRGMIRTVEPHMLSLRVALDIDQEENPRSVSTSPIVAFVSVQASMRRSGPSLQLPPE
jgi:hypothetical protein